MIVIDASAAVEILAESEAGANALELIGQQPMAAPAHFDAEVYRALRAHARRGILPRPRLSAAVRLLALFGAERVPLPPLLAPAHALGERFSAPDAFYVALAHAYDADFITSDRRLAGAAAGIVRVHLINPPSSAPSAARP